MKDRYYLRYDGSEEVRRVSVADSREIEAVGRIHSALTGLDAARAALAAAAEAVRREVRATATPRQIRADFEKFWAAGGVTALAYKEWFHGRYKLEPPPVPARGGLRLVASQSPRSLRLPEKPKKPIHREHLPREHLPPDDPLDAA